MDMAYVRNGLICLNSGYNDGSHTAQSQSRFESSSVVPNRGESHLDQNLPVAAMGLRVKIAKLFTCCY